MVQTLLCKLYVQLTVHRDNLHINNRQDASSIQNFILSQNSTFFRHLLCSSSGIISCTRGNWYVSCRLCGRCLGESGWNLTLLALIYKLGQAINIVMFLMYLTLEYCFACSWQSIYVILSTLTAQCTLTAVNFWHQRVNTDPLNL